MASPVFEAMFFGGLAEKNDPIPILDVQPDAFKALLEYIYTDKININSVDKACELCYAAKKYMLPHVVSECTKFLWADLCSKNACRAYEFAKLFEEPKLMEKCLQIMCTKTCDVIQDPSFEEVELSTIITILDQDALNIETELDIFFAINRYAEKHGLLNQNSSSNEESLIESANGEPQPGPSNRDAPAPANVPRHQEPLTIRDAVKRIRFLTLTPKQFAEGPARTALLSQNEAFAILMNISSPLSGHPMPEGFSTNKNPRSYNIVLDSPSPSGGTGNYSQAPIAVEQIIRQINDNIPERLERLPVEHAMPIVAPPNIYLDEPLVRFPTDRKMYCVRVSGNQTEILNTAVIDSSITFTVDRSICITGIQVPTQIRPANSNGHTHIFPERSDGYSELLYACLLDAASDSRLTYTHSTQRVTYNSVLEIQFDRPVYVQRNKVYKISVCFNRSGWYPFPIDRPARQISVDGVLFSFDLGTSTRDRDGLIRSIVYTYNTGMRDN
uniref:CSON010474 protein n=1 Tax=Culicoides sonorensis TaxID=179676 RepID=A0A336LFN0_CULSO